MSSSVPVLFLLAFGCSPAVAPTPAAPPPAPAPRVVAESAPAEEIPAPSSQASDVSDLSVPVASSGQRVPRTEPTTYVPTKGSFTHQGLTLRVTEIMVKRTMDGNESLRASAHLSAGGKHVDRAFDADQAAFAWNGYLIELRDGSKEAAGFAVIRAPHDAKSR